MTLVEYEKLCASEGADFMHTVNKDLGVRRPIDCTYDEVVAVLRKRAPKKTVSAPQPES
jgi:hypothetical protein